MRILRLRGACRGDVTQARFVGRLVLRRRLAHDDLVGVEVLRHGLGHGGGAVRVAVHRGCRLGEDRAEKDQRRGDRVV